VSYIIILQYQHFNTTGMSQLKIMGHDIPLLSRHAVERHRSN